MSRRQKFLAQLLSGQHDQTLDFNALFLLLEALGFEKRIRGSHHLFGKAGIDDLINIQPAIGNAVKPYQAKQVRSILLKYRAALKLDTI
ncbi:type II toxin-antitoxin system HicA family toxin [Hymenobacter artigasi]|uniref:Type II toxin-antitoxin system HicA family toxin n=1 Tax=Hymenobacter artigasi TaxID=2719616 RepID=A0ABX1HL65_9BACT|nr:type II toxin-antitoxin system HicA family toxin [Hymenobacter artigasi]NKI89543.1 hypothetical protein [Hymenobacter artigasi]